MSAPTAAPARSGASYDWALRQPDRALALVEADPATRSDTRIPSPHQVEGFLEPTALPLDPAVSLTAAIPRPRRSRPPRSPASSQTPRPTRIAATAHAGRSSTSQLRPLDSARPAIPGAPPPAACEAALHSLLTRYTTITARLAQQPPASDGHTPAQAAVSDQLAPCHIADSDLEDILFFRQFSRSEIAAVRDGLRVLSAPRGTRLDTHSTLWIVLRGAVQTSLRHGASSYRVRVAGPGRCVGHLSLITHRKPNPQPVLEAELRERAILLEISTERANSILADNKGGARRFAQAFNQDIARALNDADSPTGLEHARAGEHRQPRQPNKATSDTVSAHRAVLVPSQLAFASSHGARVSVAPASNAG